MPPPPPPPHASLARASDACLAHGLAHTMHLLLQFLAHLSLELLAHLLPKLLTQLLLIPLLTKSIPFSPHASLAAASGRPAGAAAPPQPAAGPA
eukprot:1158057-Pelagomonas_calceolata.AAC.3